MNQNLTDILVIEVADATLDEVRLLIDAEGRNGFQRQLTNIVPQAHEKFIISLDLDLGAAETCRADNYADTFGNIQLIGNFLQALAVRRGADLTADSAAPSGVGHQHAITARQGNISGQGRALITALFLDDLHQQNLPPFDDFLDFVMPP